VLISENRAKFGFQVKKHRGTLQQDALMKEAAASTPLGSFYSQTSSGKGILSNKTWAARPLAAPRSRTHTLAHARTSAGLLSSFLNQNLGGGGAAKKHVDEMTNPSIEWRTMEHFARDHGNSSVTFHAGTLSYRVELPPNSKLVVKKALLDGTYGVAHEHGVPFVGQPSKDEKCDVRSVSVVNTYTSAYELPPLYDTSKAENTAADYSWSTCNPVHPTKDFLGPKLMGFIGRREVERRTWPPDVTLAVLRENIAVGALHTQGAPPKVPGVRRTCVISKREARRRVRHMTAAQVDVLITLTMGARGN